MEREPLRLLPRASHPAVTRDARRGGDRPSRTDPSTTPSTSVEPQRCLPLSLMHPHFAPTRRSPRAPPPATRRHGTSHQPARHGSLMNPYRLQMFAGLAHPHQHRPTSMQIHTDKLPTLIEFAHRGLLRRNNVSTPSMHARDGHEERRPRSFMTSETVLTPQGVYPCPPSRPGRNAPGPSCTDLEVDQSLFKAAKTVFELRFWQ